MAQELRVVLIAFFCALGAAAGCSGPGGKGEQAPQQATLQDVADMIRATTQPNGRGPTKLADLDRVREMYPRGYEAIKSGEVVVLWGTGVKGEGEMGKGGEVIAYEKDAPTNGGYVLLTSGEVKQMSASEFQSAPRAAKK
ncbi:MAG TPA: hypothetical protein VKE74_07780 [Gemmataceae bacterium]|nr:hypothetical protein [Gemmataceae bacterium]